MKRNRRTFMQTAGGGALGALLVPARTRAQPSRPSSTQPAYDVAVVGAGVFGAWIAYQLQQAGGMPAPARAARPA